MSQQNKSNSSATDSVQNSSKAPLETDYQAMCERTKTDVEMAQYESVSQDKESSFSHSTPPAKPFWQTAQFLEACVSVAFYVATTFFTASQPFTTYERSIPYQYLNNAGEYIVNQEYNQSKTGSTVSPTVICIGALVIQQILSFVRRNMIGKSFYDMHATLCTYMIALSLNRLVTEFIKNYVGYLRPIFYEKCEPDDNYAYCTDNNDGGRKSFPSGHASISFTGCMLLTLYIHTRFGMGQHRARMERRRVFAMAAATHKLDLTMDSDYESAMSQLNLNDFEDSWGSARAKFVSIVALIPMAVATYISADRVRTNHHFPADVIGGALLGSSISAFIHGLWFS